MDMNYKYDEDMDMTEETVTGGHKKHVKTHKIITMDDVSEQLKVNFADEIADSHQYLCMARVADKAGCEEDCHYLIEMAKDEYTHAYFIHNFMHEHGIHVPEEQEEEFMHLKEKMSEFF